MKMEEFSKVKIKNMKKILIKEWEIKKMKKEEFRGIEIIIEI
jgi:hypothetical protein